jgi:hypothetical protein
MNLGPYALRKAGRNVQPGHTMAAEGHRLGGYRFFALDIGLQTTLDPNEKLDPTFGRLPEQGFFDALELGWWLSLAIFLTVRVIHRLLLT